jgi:hypothetical protein
MLTTIAYILIAVGGLAMLVGGVLLVVAAFRINTGWGLVVLLLSWLIIPLVVFALRYWPRARTGLLIALAGFIVSGLGWFVFVGSAAMSIAEPEPFEYSRQTQANSVDDAVETTSGFGNSGATAPPTATIALPQPTATPTPEPTKAPEPTPTRATNSMWQTVPYRELDQYIGERIELELTDGSSMRVVLESVTPNRITAAQRMGGGWVSYPVQRDAIREIRVPR